MRIKKRINKNKLIRLSVQLLFVVIVLLVSLNHQLQEKGVSIPIISSASLHSVCPFGGVVSIYSLLTEGNFVQKIHEASFIVLGIVLFLAVLFGPVFCGWICPLGTVQEFIGNLGRWMFKSRYNKFIPYKYDKYFRLLRYVILGWVVFVTAYTGKIVFSDIDPYYALFNFWTSEVAVGGIIILILTLISSLFIERPWCRYSCPLGAFLGLSNFIRIFKIRRNSSTCVSCRKCDSVCPMNIQVSDKNNVTDHHCISCLKCTSEIACPINDTVIMSINGGK